MDFEDDGIESSPRVNSDADTLSQTKPIISFSPQRCRFDSDHSSRKSSLSFPIADLESFDADPVATTTNVSNNSNSSTVHILPTSEHVLGNSVPSSIHSGLVATPPQHHHDLAQASLFTRVQNPQQQQRFPQHYHIRSQALISNSSTQQPRLPFASATSVSTTIPPPPVDANSVGLMVNGAVAAAPSTSTLELQKRLEKRIAQASAGTVANTTTTQTASSNTISHRRELATSDDIIVPEMTASATTCAPPLPSSSSVSMANGDQISFSPPASASCSSASQELQQTFSEFWESADTEGGKSSGNSEPLGSAGTQSTSVSATASVVVNSDVGELIDSMSQVPKETLNSTARIPTSSELPPPPTANKAGGTHQLTTASDPSTTVNKRRKSEESKGSKGLRGGTTTTTTTATTSCSTSSSGTTSSAQQSTSSVMTVVNSGFDMRKVGGLLPPQRLAIPCKSSQMSSSENRRIVKVAVPQTAHDLPQSPTSREGSRGSGFSSKSDFPPATRYSGGAPLKSTAPSGRSAASGNGSVKGNNSSKLSSEKKPLVQWDSDESEEELSFFPPSKRGVITDNLSIDNMSLSGEEEDLHLTPPRPLTKKCPCDPRSWLERRQQDLATTTATQHGVGDPTSHVIPTKSCVIS